MPTLRLTQVAEGSDKHRVELALEGDGARQTAVSRFKFSVSEQDREDVRWYGVGPAVDLSDDSRSLAFCLSGASQGDDDLYVMANAYGAALEFTIQTGAASEWQRIVDTGCVSPDDFREPPGVVALTSARYVVGPRSVVVLLRPRRG